MSHPSAPQTTRGALGLVITTLGVVYGDIGTSPLYAMRECFHGDHGVPVTHDNILGVLSLIFYSLALIITVKYVAYVLRADNKGEGGILALMALATSRIDRPRTTYIVTLLGLFGAALLYGDGMITPAISVLSAVEGLSIATPALSSHVVPITLVILVGIFSIQSRGTARLGSVFGPVMLVWFVTLGVLGMRGILARPEVLWALDPLFGVRFLANNGLTGFLVLGAVFFVVTGGEALYADMGHFGRRPIRQGWLFFVFPSLVLNYFGQGALLLSDPSAAVNPFYHLAPDFLLIPMVVLSTCAAIIASQALISGAFSLTRQATMLGFWPRVQVRHTSARHIGQIYVPTINWLLMISTLGLVLGFGSSANLAAAYGIAVAMTMVMTTLLAHEVSRQVFGFSTLTASLITGTFLIADVAFFSATVVKIGQGGWFPLAVALVMFTLMSTWKKGRTLLLDHIRESTVVLSDFYELMRVERPARVPGTAVFMTGSADGTPPALMRNFLHNRVVHENNILLTVVTAETPRVSNDERLQVMPLEDGFVRVTARYGFTEEPDIPALLSKGGVPGYDPDYTTFFFGRETILAEGNAGMNSWRKRIFSFMTQSSQRATAFFCIPPEQVVEIGSQVEI